MKNLIFKSSFHEKLKMLLIAIGLVVTNLTSQVWANYAYLDLTGTTWWYNDEAAFRLDKNGTGNVDSYTEISGTGVWRFDIGTYTGSATFKRMNKDRTSEWNYANVSISSSQNVFHTENNNGVTTRTSFVIDYIHGTNYVYFDNSVSNFSNNIYFVIGHDYSPSGGTSKYSKAYKMSQVTGTKLYYVSVTDEWADATYFAVIASTSSSISATDWGSDGLSSKGGSGYTAAYKTVYNMEGGTFLLTTASSGNNKALTITYYDGYGSIPTNTMTASVRTKVAGGTYGSSYNSPTTVTVQTRYLNGNGSSSTQSASVSTSAKTANKADVTTGAVSYSFTALADDAQWQFDGWGTSNSTVSSTNSTYSITAGSAASKTNTTIYAFFTRKPLLTVNKGANGKAASGTATNNAKTSWDITATPNTGYRFKQWTTNSGSVTYGSATTASTTATISADAEITASYNENLSSVTIAAGSNGSVTNAGTYNLGVATTKSSTATANNGYYFTSWSKTGNAALSSTSNATTTVKGDGTNGGSGTATANFAARWVLRGSKDADGDPAGGMPGWSTTTANMTAGSTTTKTVTLEPNVRYKYRIYDKKNPTLNSSIGCGATGSADQPLGTGWTLNGSTDAHFVTKGYGTYTFSVTVNASDDRPSVTVTGPTSRTISMGTITWSEGVATPAANAGGTNTAKTTENSVDYAITNGQYIRDGGTAVFTATPNSGYQFIGWFDASTFNPETQEPISAENPYTVSNITENKTVYALFKEIVFDVTVKLDGTTPTTVKVGQFSHPSITATVPSGKVFDRWETTGSATVASHTSPTTTITGASDNQSTVTAVYKDLPKIYVDITAATGWTPTDMYVVFYKNGGYFDANNGTGLSSTYVITSTPCKMTKVSGKKIWYYSYDPNNGVFAGKTITCVAFVDHTFAANYGNFTSCTAVYRTDFDACMNMFVVTDNTGTNKNTSCYYRNTNAISDDAARGYWRNYGEKNSGFYLNNLNGGSFEFTNEDGGNTYSTSVNLDKNKTYYFYIGGCGGQNWSNNQGTYPFNTSNRTRDVIKYTDVASDAKRCKLTTTEAGYYTFKLTPSNSAAQMSVTIDFPIAANDYRAVVTHGGKGFPSNILKSTGTISLWLAEGDNVLSIQKCTNANSVTWTQQVARTVNVDKAGVYTMTLTCNEASSTVSTPVAYEGAYYIRTDCAPGGWRDYTENKMTYNELTFSESDATTFDYYFCKWISNAGTNVRFVVGNEINMAISDTLKHDAALGNGSEETLPAAANVRFSYNSFTNEVKRAYISGATNPNDRFLIMHTNNKVYTSGGASINYHSTYSNLNANEAYFFDRNNWVYYIELQAQSGSTAYLTAHYNNADRDLYGSSGSPKPVLTSTNTTTKYNILVTYDFKTNNLLTAWHPGSTTVDDDITSVPSVMFIRKHQEQADQVTIGTGSVAKSTIYGVMKFNKYILNNQSEAAGHAPTTLSATERDLYWISFPFDVNLSDVFGFGEYGKHWIIEEYDGAERAAKGFWADSPGFWKFVTNRSGKVLEKGKGYVLALDLDELRISSDIWNNNVTDVYLYFPSTEELSIENVKNTDITTVDKHTCTINRQKEGEAYDINKNRTIADSNWNLVGVPLFANSSGFTFSAKYYYAWDYATNTYSAETATTGSLQTMKAYMVQFGGTLNWYTHTPTNASIARRAKTEDERFEEFKVDLMQGEESLDHTFVRLSDEDEVTENFEFGHDMCKEFNGGKANIYTFVENYIPAAGNSLPMSLTQTTLVPLGVRIVKEGEYSFSIPEGTNGVGVTLVDNELQTRTNLALMDYAVTLPAGDNNERFVLEISPIEQTTTNVEAVTGDGLQVTGVCKKLIDGVLYIVKDGKVFDARGARIQ